MEPITTFLNRTCTDVRLLVFDQIVSSTYELRKVMRNVSMLYDEATKILSSMTERAGGRIPQRNKFTKIQIDRVFGLIERTRFLHEDDVDSMSGLLDDYNVLVRDMVDESMQYRKIYQHVVVVTACIARLAQVTYDRRSVMRSVLNESGTKSRHRLLEAIEEEDNRVDGLSADFAAVVGVTSASVAVDSVVAEMPPSEVVVTRSSDYQTPPAPAGPVGIKREYPEDLFLPDLDETSTRKLKFRKI
ncbi:unknown protein [Seminavis robusta]|uniref:Uncharacterized protein n=1 Tax=Seminavis robusta TaxID=568900 RepID=A0A9N8ETE2_9STRA|nr:unknown protein [Seminavis robusta]|eukprot:Sro1714_g293010.1 n/a (245) ;mRNA; f:1092-1826